MSKLIAKIPGWTKMGMEYATPRLQRFWTVAKVELRPPTPGEMGVALKDAQKGFTNIASGKAMQLTVRQAFQNTLVATEVLCWFFVGEVIGRGNIIGYNV